MNKAASPGTTNESYILHMDLSHLKQTHLISFKYTDLVLRETKYRDANVNVSLDVFPIRC